MARPDRASTPAFSPAGRLLVLDWVEEIWALGSSGRSAFLATAFISNCTTAALPIVRCSCKRSSRESDCGSIAARCKTVDRGRDAEKESAGTAALAAGRADRTYVWWGALGIAISRPLVMVSNAVASP